MLRRSPRRTAVWLGLLATVGLLSSACTADSGVSEAGSATIPPDDDEPASTPPLEVPAAPPTEAPATTDAAPAEFEPDEIAWEDYDDGVEVGTLEVPVDYADPDGPTMELFLARHLAADPDQRIGTMLVNPGGPGFPGSDFALFADQVFARDVVDRFDIVGWDPRGVGLSEPAIDCIDDFDPYYAEIDPTPETPEEREQVVGAAEDFAARCVEGNDEILFHIGTNDSARDIDTIRRALGEDQLSFFGFSYGSELGATWATLFPDTVRAAVLDGASSPNADRTESLVFQLRGFERTLQSFLDRCSADPECEFHSDGDAAAAFDALMADLDENPVPTVDGRPPANLAVANTAVIQAMYSESFWPVLEQALADARAGDGALLLSLFDSYYQRQPDGTYGNELEAFQVISCMDSAERRTVAEEDELAPLYVEAAPRLAPEGSTGSYSCTFLPPTVDPRVEITGAGAPPIVVIGTTGDPATPFEGTQEMADTLPDGRLIVVDADEHTGYSISQCAQELVSTYLIDLEPPADGTECP